MKELDFSGGDENPKWEIYHEDQTYLFDTTESKDQFLAEHSPNEDTVVIRLSSHAWGTK